MPILPQVEDPTLVQVEDLLDKVFKHIKGESTTSPAIPPDAAVQSHPCRVAPARLSYLQSSIHMYAANLLALEAISF